MRIEKVVINGFKSFGKKTEILFDENLIGIVGPNGSGKSNVIDAIRWVLGQQKMTELRTKSNTDVIFSGSDSMSPKNVAEVTIFFDNKDKYLDIEYTEVAIKRRLFRNGENEYYINNTRCRLMDVNNLILDKGFGKDSFSIISQGKVDEIIMSKPENRRDIVDDVAGITKYKVKKKVTINKLNLVNENLDRINFIVEEVESRIAPLKRESDKAIKYKKIKKELEENEKTLLTNKIYVNKKELDHLNDYLTTLKKENGEKNNLIEKYEEEIASIDQEISQEQVRISEINEKLNITKNKQITFENEIKLLSRKMELNNDNSENMVEAIRENLTSVKKQEEEIIHKKANLEPKKASIDSKIKILKDELAVDRSRLYELYSKKEDITANSEQNKIPYHINKLLTEKSDLVLGTIKQNIKIYSKYERAIQTILGYRRNEIIVEHDKDVKELINFLNTNKLGKATFSPLNKVKPRFVDSKTKEILEKSDLDYVYALDCIDYDSKIKNAVASLLGNIIITSDIESARKINETINSKYQVVTLNGDIFATSGKITGGYDKSRNKSFDDLDKIEINIKELTSNVEKINKEIDILTFEQSEYKIELDILESKLINVLEEKKSLELEYNEFIDDNEDNSSIYNIENDLEQLNESTFNLTKEKFQLEENIKNNIDMKEKKNSQVVDLRADFKVKIQEETESKMKIESLEEEIKELIDILGEKYSISFQKAFENSIILEDIAQSEKYVKELKKEIQAIGFVNLDAIEEYEVQKERLDFYLNNREDLLSSQNKILGVIEKIDNFVVDVFSETFAKLNTEFKIIFEKLFDGGSATLKLTNEEDLLTTGVEIIAKPPGKRNQIIGLLSGGEKALTAIALLFAIIKVRVVPFSILDEVEAALDEANVSKYIEYLKVFSQNTQFIVITHRQATMEQIDKLYGVTMVEKGISSVLDINLKENDKEQNA